MLHLSLVYDNTVTEKGRRRKSYGNLEEKVCNDSRTKQIDSKRWRDAKQGVLKGAQAVSDAAVATAETTRNVASRAVKFAEQAHQVGAEAMSGSK